VKWTITAPSREAVEGVAMLSMKTAPVNHSPGPAMVSMEFLVTCMSLSLSVAWVNPNRTFAAPAIRMASCSDRHPIY
jgi:hypothetical protein